ncbi:MAG: Gfo/Idh/MocA family protein [Chthoniobacterales bacterium]
MRRGALIGFGEVAQHGHLPAYDESSEAKIVAVVDPAEGRRGLATVASFASVDDLAAAGLEIDFVDICTPPAFHGPPMLQALRHGWDVLCEKPLLLDLRELGEVREAAQESGCAIVPVHNWKYAPIVRRATELLREGTIGQLHEVEIETLRVQDCAVADPSRPSWRRDAMIAGGGILMDHGWHVIYLAEHWFGEEAIEMRATLRRPSPQDVEDEAEMTLIFPSGSANVFLTWRAERRGNAMRLIGDRGQIVIDDDVLKNGTEAIPFQSALSAGSHHADWFEAMLPDVLEKFREPAKARASFEEAARCLQLIRAAYERA